MDLKATFETKNEKESLLIIDYCRVSDIDCASLKEDDVTVVEFIFDDDEDTTELIRNTLNTIVEFLENNFFNYKDYFILTYDLETILGF